MNQPLPSPGPPWWAPPPFGAAGPVGPIRWGVPDALLVWFAGLVGGVVGGVVGAAISGAQGDALADDPWVFGLSVVAQISAMIAALVWVSRAKGRGSLRADFGLTVRLRSRDAWYLPLGLGLQIALGILLLPIAQLDQRRQVVVEQIQSASGAELALLALTAGLVAPIVEEVLFRGLLLRSLLRRTSATAAVAVSGLAFGVVHLVDPDAIVVVPGLTALGMLAALTVVRTGDLSRAIWLHIGFNSVVVIAALAG